MIELTEHDQGREISAPLGETITLRLQENPTTGYRWALDSAGQLQTVQNIFIPPDTGQPVGAGGTRVLQFKAARLGSHIIRLRLCRPWEGAGSALQHFNAAIVVR
jgi:inhibitor of cysteine peptidase